MALPLLWLRPGWLSLLRAAGISDFSERSHKRERILLLVELQGGNDGLNTVIPYDDAAYYRARPQLAIPRDQVRQLTPKLGLHPALSPLMPLWERKGAGVAPRVRYPGRIDPISFH